MWLPNAFPCLKKSGLQGRVMLKERYTADISLCRGLRLPWLWVHLKSWRFHTPCLAGCQSYHCSEDGWSHTDLLKPGPDDGYPVLDGSDGVGVAEGQDGVPHTGRFIEGSSFFLQFLHEFLQQKQKLPLAVGIAENKTPVTVMWLAKFNKYTRTSTGVFTPEYDPLIGALREKKAQT